MRTATEGLRLLVAAAELWWSRLPVLIGVFSLGFGLHLLGLTASVRLGSAHPVLGTLVFVLAVLSKVGALVLMLWLCRPPTDHESALDVAALAIGPFLAVYAVWGLVEDELYALFSANIAVSGLGGTAEWSINLQWLRFYVLLALVVWVLRQGVGRLSRNRPHRPLLLLGVVLEGTWTFASALALLAGLGRAIDWISSRAVWRGLVDGWYALLSALPDVRLAFDLTLPEAVAEAARWLTGTLLPGFWSAVLLPVVWLALTAVVYGYRDLGAHTVAAGSVWDVARRRAGPGRTTGPWRTMLRRVAAVATTDLRTKYLPVARALRMLWATGTRFLAAYLVLATVVETTRSWAVLGLARLLGPRDPYLALAWSWAEDLVVGCVFTTAAVAVYAAAARRVLDPDLTVAGVPAPDPALRPTTGAGR
jgi:hypothetical protein